MRINFDRLSQLAGLPASNENRSLYEGKGHGDGTNQREGSGPLAREAEEEFAPPMEEIDDTDEMMNPMEEMDHSMEEMMDDPMNEMIDVDEVMLVQELRRAKRIMQENKRRSLSESRQRKIFEAQLKQVIDEEVQNVMDEMNLTSQWVYGDRRPRNSRKGYTNQGSMMPGIGFRRR